VNAVVEGVVGCVVRVTAVVEVDGSVGCGAVLTVAADVVDADEDELVLIASVDATGATEVLDPHAARTIATQIDDRTASPIDR
jgi:hypothetical protein